MALGEFELIARHFARPGVATPGVALGIGDDGALLELPADHELVAVTDTIVSGIHFPPSTAPRAVGHRAVAVNLSDLAAMGATPRWLLLALTLPETDYAWLAAFAEGFHALGERHGCALVGGDTTRGPLSVTVTALGSVPRGQALRRSGARPGDALCASGTLGDGAAGLRCMRAELSTRATGARDLVLRFLFPEPRVALGLALRGAAHACIDVSDGLLADVGHLLEAGGVGATIDADALPRSAAFRAAVPAAAQQDLALAGGDDYELAFACAPERVEAIAAVAARDGLRVTRIGTIEATPGLRVVDAAGRAIAPRRTGYDHFR